MEEILAKIRGLIEAATVASDSRHTALWCLEQLPALYKTFFETYENRFREEVLRLESAVLKALTKESKKAALAVKVELNSLHSLLGFQGVAQPSAA